MSSQGNPLQQAALSSAKSALNHANAFSARMPQLPMEPGVHKPLSMAMKKAAPKATPKPQPKASAPAAAGPTANPEGNIGNELAEKIQNVKDYNDAPKYHKGGKIEKDGKQVVDAEKGETVLPNKDPKKAVKLAMEHLSGMGAGMASKKKKSSKKSAVKHEAPKHTHGRKKGRVTDTQHKHHANGSHTTTHIHDMSHPDNAAMPAMPGDNETTYASSDMDGLHDGLEQHVGQPNPGEAEAMAPPAAAEAAPAPAPAA